MTNHIPEDQIHIAANLFKHASHAVALTGAGISTPSGIPDFRSTGSGLWNRYDPMEVASLLAFRYHPERFFSWIQPLARKLVEAEPNAAHVALARLEAAGYLAGVVTQNIDDLHGKAGSKEIYEIHGHLREAVCVSCQEIFSTEGLLEEFARGGEVPRCPRCEGILKPKVVLFGEQLPFDVVQAAEKLLAKSDLILVAGSSLEVTPAAQFPIKPLNNGAHLIIVNHTPTYLDERATVIFRQDVSFVLPRLADEVIRE